MLQLTGYAYNSSTRYKYISGVQGTVCMYFSVEVAHIFQNTRYCIDIFSEIFCLRAREGRKLVRVALNQRYH
jgi:hypothetical protein